MQSLNSEAQKQDLRLRLTQKPRAGAMAAIGGVPPYPAAVSRAGRRAKGARGNGGPIIQ